MASSLPAYPTRLTIRSSRPHVVASAMCYALRLHMSAAPPRVGLTQALGRSERYEQLDTNLGQRRLALLRLVGIPHSYKPLRCVCSARREDPWTLGC